MAKNWIAVASAEHARLGRDSRLGERRDGPPQASSAPSGGSAAHEVASVGAHGFMQVGHGKMDPLKKLKPGDRVAYYSPTVVFGDGKPFQQFVSIGTVLPGEPYVFDMGKGFAPWRRDVAYLPSKEASILPLLDDFDFVENRQRWGYKFRFGMFEISERDMGLIARAMGVETAVPPNPSC